jgi:peroxidase
MGETFTAILVDQFTRLRDGDRFWYQYSLPNRLVRDIENTSLADIIRRNTELTKLQENVFFFNESTVMIDSSIEQPQPQEQSAQPQENNIDRGNPPPPPPGPRPEGRPPRGHRDGEGHP